MPMYDTLSLISAGIPLSKKMLKYGNSVDQDGNIVKQDPLKYNLDYGSILRIMAEQNKIETIERYMWTNLPPGLNADLIERLLYYRGKGVLYFNDKVEKFQFLPFSLNGLIDEYGRYLRVNTFPFTGVDQNKENGKKLDYVYENLEIVYDLPYNKEMLEKARGSKPVGLILDDSTLSINQQPVIRHLYVQPILRMMATLMQIINTAMFGNADHSAVKVENESELESFRDQVDAINQDILKGRRFSPLLMKLDVQPLKTSNTANLEGLFGCFNSLSNLLKSVTGIANAGIFDKKAHLLQEEQRLNGSNSDDIYYNGLRKRQELCLMIQAYYQMPTWCESKRAMSEAEEENYLMGETSDPDNTQFNPQQGDNSNEDN